MKAMRLIWILP